MEKECNESFGSIRGDFPAHWLSAFQYAFQYVQKSGKHLSYYKYYVFGHCI
jgi:hypothetical protein